MKTTGKLVLMAAILGITTVAAGTAWAQDAAAVVDKRQDFMKAQGRALGAVKNFTEDKGDLAAAQAGGADLVKMAPQIPSLFPQNTGMAQLPGKSFAKPEIWAQWDKFIEADRNATARAQALNAALQGSDKAAITAAFAAMGQEGCGGCHRPFRQPKT